MGFSPCDPGMSNSKNLNTKGRHHSSKGFTQRNEALHGVNPMLRHHARAQKLVLLDDPFFPHYQKVRDCCVERLRLVTIRFLPEWLYRCLNSPRVRRLRRRPTCDRTCHENLLRVSSGVASLPTGAFQHLPASSGCGSNGGFSAGCPADPGGELSAMSWHRRSGSAGWLAARLARNRPSRRRFEIARDCPRKVDGQ